MSTLARSQETKSCQKVKPEVEKSRTQ